MPNGHAACHTRPIWWLSLTWLMATMQAGAMPVSSLRAAASEQLHQHSVHLQQESALRLQPSAGWPHADGHHGRRRAKLEKRSTLRDAPSRQLHGWPGARPPARDARGAAGPRRNTTREGCHPCIVGGLETKRASRTDNFEIARQLCACTHATRPPPRAPPTTARATDLNQIRYM